MATVPVPRTYVTNEVLTATILNGTTGIKGPLDFLLNPPRVKVWQNATQSLASGTSTLLTFDSEAWDTDTMHSNVTNTSRLVCNAAGLYELDFNVFWLTSATGYREVVARKNAAGSNVGGSVVALSRVAAVSGAASNVNMTAEVQLAVGDYIELFGLQNSGAALSTAGGNDYTTWASLRWVANS